MASVKYIVRIRTGERVEYVHVPARSAKVRKFRVEEIARATRFRREEAYTISCSARTMNPDSVVDFLEVTP